VVSHELLRSLACTATAHQAGAAMKKLLLTIGFVAWTAFMSPLPASAQTYGYRSQNGGAVIRIGNTVRVYDRNNRLLAQGSTRGGIANLRMTADGTHLKVKVHPKNLRMLHLLGQEK
jgi:hypothetical protein